MNQLAKILTPLSFCVAAVFPKNAHAEAPKTGEVSFTTPFLPAAKLTLGDLPELWHEPPQAVPLKLSALTPKPVSGVDVNGLALLLHSWPADRPWSAPQRNTKLWLGFGGKVGLGRLRFSILASCSDSLFGMPRRPCQARFGLSLRG